MRAEYDSRIETWVHIAQVGRFLHRCVVDLLRRARDHDQSKLLSPEVEVFDTFTPRLAGITYGSDEYKECLNQMRPAIEHNQKHNRHHPEFHEQGIRGMNLIDLVEMLCDWKAATLRHADGDIRKSIEINQQRFGYSDELRQIFLNTLQLIDAVEEESNEQD